MKDIPESLEELARRNAGTSSTAYQGARRRREASGTAAAQAPFAADPAEITRRALRVAEARGALGVPQVEAEQLAEAARLADPEADFVAPILVGLLRHLPKVARGAGVEPGALAALDAQHAEMSDLRIAATQLRRDVMDTRRTTGAQVRALSRALVEHLEARLAPGRLPRAEQDLLRSHAGEVLLRWQELTQAPLQERERTRAETRLHEEKKEEEEEQLLLARTLLALRAGAEVDLAEWDRAAEILDSLSAGPPVRDRRRQPRSPA